MTKKAAAERKLDSYMRPAQTNRLVNWESEALHSETVHGCGSQKVVPHEQPETTYKSKESAELCREQSLGHTSRLQRSHFMFQGPGLTAETVQSRGYYREKHCRSASPTWQTSSLEEYKEDVPPLDHVQKTESQPSPG